MTREEARIRLIKKREELMHKYMFEEAEVLTIAIEALKEAEINCVHCPRYFETEDETGVHSHCEDLISRQDVYCILDKMMVKRPLASDRWVIRDIDKAIKSLPSDEAVPQSEQYKKGFDDAKRAFLVEYARESENMRKRNAQLEVMLNAQKAISTDRPKGEWINENGTYYANCSKCGYQMDTHQERGYFRYCPNCGAEMRGEIDEL